MPRLRAITARSRGCLPVSRLGQLAQAPVQEGRRHARNLRDREEELLAYKPLETVQRKRRRRDREARKKASKDESQPATL